MGPLISMILMVLHLEDEKHLPLLMHLNMNLNNYFEDHSVIQMTLEVGGTNNSVDGPINGG